MASSAFSPSVTVPSRGFAVTKGNTVAGGLHDDSDHRFRRHGPSWPFTRPDRGPGGAIVNARPTMLVDPGPLAVPFVETMKSEKLPWVTTPAVRRFEGFPSADVHASPTEAFANE